MKEIIPEIAHKVKSYFLGANSNLEEMEIKEAPLTELHKLTEDDEVWLVQCPRNIDAEDLLNHEIKFKGKTSMGNLETVVTEYKTPKTITFGCKRKKKFSYSNLKIEGSIVVREKLQTTRNEEEFKFCKQERVPFPDNLKERHPLLGANFSESIKLPETVLAKLKEARESIVKDVEIKPQDVVNIEESDDDDEVVFVKSEKVKKSKKRNSSVEDSSQKKKKSKKEEEEQKILDQTNDFQWIFST